MPIVGQMFPSKFLQPEDLEVGKLTPVTIERVYLHKAERNSASDEIESEWLMKLVEFRKPMFLKKFTGRMIADALKEADTDKWAGRQIFLTPVTIMAYGKAIPVINSSILLPPPTSAGLLPTGGDNATPIGDKAAGRFLEVLKGKGATTDHFLRFLKRRGPKDSIGLAFGVSPEAYPRALVPLMKQFLDEIQTASPAAVCGDTVNTQTGEVLDSVPAGAKPAGPVVSDINEDDIPF